MSRVHLRTVSGGKTHLATGYGSGALFPACVARRHADPSAYRVVVGAVTCSRCREIAQAAQQDQP